VLDPPSAIPPMTLRKQALLCICFIAVAILACLVFQAPEGRSERTFTDIPEVRQSAAMNRPAPSVSRITKDSTRVPVTTGFLDHILSTDGTSVEIGLPGGETARGRATMVRRDDDGLLLVQGRITRPESGRFMFQRQTAQGVAGAFVGFVHYDESDVAYQIRPSAADGSPELAETTAHEVLCRAYAEPPEDGAAGDPLAADENGIVQLQSLPAAAAVIYLDYDGEEREFASWGYINAEAYAATNDQITQVWQGVSEDFRPFNINVTTVRSVYDNAAPGRRMHVVVTPTRSASPLSGGAAYVGSFNWTGEMVCWSFYGVGKNAVEVISHEAGHTLGLLHDGRTSPEEKYYRGHGDWAPIMGLGYDGPLSQWSKGEYDSANNAQDDLATIAGYNNGVGFREDDHGSGFASASWLQIDASGVVSNAGVIESTGDEDGFRFSTAGGVVELNIGAASFNPNLDIKAEISNSAGDSVAEHDPADSLNAAFEELYLPAGDYVLRVSGTGKGNSSDGYSNYASLGCYTVSGTVAGGSTADIVVIEERLVHDVVMLAPIVSIVSPVLESVSLPLGAGLRLRASVDDGRPVSWTMLSGPSAAVIETPSAEETCATFPVSGVYVLRVASDDDATVADDVTVHVVSPNEATIVGSGVGDGVAGAYFSSGIGRYTLTGASSGMNASEAADGFYMLGQEFPGDFDVRTRVASMSDIGGTDAERAGIVVRTSVSGSPGAASGFIGFQADGDGLLVQRSGDGLGNDVSGLPSMALLSWCRVLRSGDDVEFLYSEDGVSWASAGTMSVAGEVSVGLCWASGTLREIGNAEFEDISGFPSLEMGAVADAGADVFTGVGESVYLFGSMKEDGRPVSPEMTQVVWTSGDGAGTPVFGNPVESITTVTCDVPGIYQLRFYGSDGMMETFDETVLTVMGAARVALSPFEAWRLAEFGDDAGDPSVSGEMADADHDGVSNLLEYAFGTDPNVTSVARVSHEMVQNEGSRYIRLRVDRNPSATDLEFAVEVTSDLSDPGSWSEVDTVVVTDTPDVLLVRDAAGGSRRFMRLRVNRVD
jgi:hypothetical protein